MTQSQSLFSAEARTEMWSFRKAMWETLVAQIPQSDKDSKNAVPAECFWQGQKRTDTEDMKEELQGRNHGCTSLADSTATG